MIVDAHLDIGWNALEGGRGFLGPPAPGYVVSREALVSAGVGLIFATLYTAPARARRAMRTRFVYENAHEAHIMAMAQVGYYRACGLPLIRDVRDLQKHLRGWRKGRLAAILLMEGADPVETPSQLGAWTDRGVRIIGPAWGRTRYSGGTGAPGGLTALGEQLLKAMRRKRVILDPATWQTRLWRMRSRCGADRSCARTAMRGRWSRAIARSPTPPPPRSLGEEGCLASASTSITFGKRDQRRWRTSCATACTWREPPADQSTSASDPTWMEAFRRDLRPYAICRS